MRKLLWLALGFGAACVFCVYLLPGSYSAPLAALGLISSLLLGIFGRKRVLLRCAALTLLGCSFGLGWYLSYDSIYLKEAAKLDGKEITAAIRTSDYSYDTGYGMGVDGSVKLGGKEYQVRAYLDAGEPIEPGTLMTGNFLFRLTTPDGKQDGTYHSGKGIFLLAYQEGELLLSKAGKEALQEWASRLRQDIEEILDGTFSEDVSPFVKALLMGDTRDLSYETDTALKISGIRHVVAVSGLHVSILFALLTAVTFKKRYLMALLGFPLLFLFAAVAGFTPSVTRACIMSALMLLALLVNRAYDRLTALSFAALVMMLGNPLVVTSVSFQLSVASVLGICLFDAPIRKWLASLIPMPTKRSLRKTGILWLQSSISVTLSATVLTMPLCAIHFGVISLISVVTNLLALWVISFVFYGLVAVCVLSFFWESGAAALAWVVAWPIRYVLTLSALLAKFPLAAVYTRSIYICFWLVFAYLLLLVFLVSKNKRPGMLFCCAVLGLCLSIFLSWLEPMKDDMRMTMLDVGQGQCILLQSRGKTVLVDCGGNSADRSADIAAETLLAMGIPRLDGLILSHYDEDHAGGAENLLKRIPAEVLVLPPAHTDRVLPAAHTVYADREVRFGWENTVLTVFPAEYPGTGNEKSLCILFDTENCDILITGDRTGFGERMLLRYHDIPDVDVLIAGHHGAESSTCTELLEAVKPETVCISVAEQNLYGHPHEKLLKLLFDFGCAVYRTDLHGDIIIRR